MLGSSRSGDLFFHPDNVGALTAPEGVAPSGPDQRKRAHGRPFWTRIGHGADNRRSRPCRPPMIFHKPGERPPREPDPPPGIPHRLRRGLAAKPTPARGPRPGWLLDGGWASCGMTPGAEPDPVFGQPRRRSANLGVHVRCHGLGITESQQPACTDASRFHSVADSARLTCA
jgi:hypothetical protein